MSWKEILTLKDWFSYRQKVGLLVVAGVVCGLGGLFMYLLRAHTYFIGDDPAACVNCHIMTPYYATWSHSSHGRDATCNDCHVPHQNIALKYGFKATDEIALLPFFGPYFAYAVSSEYKYKGETAPTDQFRPNRNNMGFKLGCGAEFNKIYAEVGYQFGVTNFMDSDDFTAHNNAFFLNLGLNF